MKLVMDEKLKHRLIGLAVIISIAAIFAPAIFRKSGQNLETISVRVAVPPKPEAPDVVLSNEKDLFKTTKIAKVVIPDLPAEKQLSQNQDENLSEELPQKDLEKVSKIEPVMKPGSVHVALNNSGIHKNTIAHIKGNPRDNRSIHPNPGRAINPKFRPTGNKHASIKKDTYAVQLASFSKLSNAESLMKTLKAKGYKANLIKIPSRQGMIYKVSVGNKPTKNEALQLRNQLASRLQLNGLIINGVS